MTETRGVLFDIKEFALYDGPGLRCTVFMKGCPLRCAWCHNPEGLSPEPETMRTASGERTVGAAWTVSSLVEKLRGYKPVFGKEGGVTFSGGEPLMQGDFVAEALRRLRREGIHTVLQTSGYATQSVFRAVCDAADLVYFDLKLVDREMHWRFTGKDNAPIMDNLSLLDRMDKPYRLRIPLIPGVTDTDGNYTDIAKLVKAGLGGAALQGIDLMPYNRAAGGKYEAVGRKFDPGYDESRPCSARPEIFENLVGEVKTL